MLTSFKKSMSFMLACLFFNCFIFTQAHAQNTEQGNTQNPNSQNTKSSPEDFQTPILQNLSFVGGYVREHPTARNVFLPFLNQVALDLDNKITFKYYSTNELYPETETFNALNDGRSDFGVLRPGLFPEKMPLSTVLCLPYMASNAIVGSLLAQDIFKKFPEIRDEFPENSKFFTGWTSTAYQLHSKNPIKTINDIKGKKIIAWEPPLSRIIEKIEGIPINISTRDSYVALRTGKADAILAPIAPIRTFKISDIATHHLILNLAVTGFSLSCYTPRWEQFESDIQRYFQTQGGAHFSFNIAEGIEAGAMTDKKYMQGLGQMFYTLSEAETEELKNMFANYHQDWVNSMPEEKRALAQEILDYALERATYYKEQYNTGIYGEWGEIYFK